MLGSIDELEDDYFTKYIVSNNRQICSDQTKNGVCTNGKLIMSKDILIDNVNRVSSEIVINEVNLYELINKDNEFFINDIVDIQVFK